MKQAGNVVHADIMQNKRGQSNGCGLVEFSSASEARRAIELLHDTDLDGRLIFVREDREGGATGASRGPPLGASLGRGSSSAHTNNTNSGSGSGKAANNDSGFVSIGCRLYVGNLAWDVQWQDLKDHFKIIAPVVHADVMVGADGRSKGCGIVEFARPEDAVQAYNRLNNTMLKGREVFVREDREE